MKRAILHSDAVTREIYISHILFLEGEKEVQVWGDID